MRTIFLYADGFERAEITCYVYLNRIYIFVLLSKKEILILFHSYIVEGTKSICGLEHDGIQNKYFSTEIYLFVSFLLIQL